MSEYDEAFAAASELSPSDLAERHVIGSLMLDPSVLRGVQAEVVPSDFADLRLGSIYRGIVAMIALDKPVDMLAVWDRLASWDVRGIDLPELNRWADQVSTPTTAPYYARLVREAAIVRNLRKIGTGLMSPQDPALALSAAIDQLRLLRDRDVVEESSGPKLLGEVLDVAETEDAYDWTVPGLLERRDRLVLTGTEGGGKSTFLRQIAVCASAGIHPFRFSPIEPMRVLVIDTENSEKQWRRAVRGMADRAGWLGTADPRVQLSLECVTAQMDITRPSDQGSLHRKLEDAKPDILLIGPLYRLVPRSIKDDDDAAPVLAALDALRDAGDVTMLIEAHAGHATSGKERDLRPRGSSALLGWPEFGLGLRRDYEGDGRLKSSIVRWRGDRDHRNWPEKLSGSSRQVPQDWPWMPAGAY